MSHGVRFMSELCLPLTHSSLCSYLTWLVRMAAFKNYRSSELQLRIEKANIAVAVDAFQRLLDFSPPSQQVCTSLVVTLLRKEQLWPRSQNPAVAPATDQLAPRLQTLGYLSEDSEFEIWLRACTPGSSMRAERLHRIRMWCGLRDTDDAPRSNTITQFITKVCQPAFDAPENQDFDLLCALLHLPRTVSLACLHFLVNELRIPQSVCAFAYLAALARMRTSKGVSSECWIYFFNHTSADAIISELALFCVRSYLSPIQRLLRVQAVSPSTLRECFYTCAVAPFTLCTTSRFSDVFLELIMLHSDRLQYDADETFESCDPRDLALGLTGGLIAWWSPAVVTVWSEFITKHNLWRRVAELVRRYMFIYENYCVAYSLSVSLCALRSLKCRSSTFIPNSRLSTCFCIPLSARKSARLSFRR